MVFEGDEFLESMGLDPDPTFSQSPTIPTLPTITPDKNAFSPPDTLYQSATTSETPQPTSSLSKSHDTTNILKQWLKGHSDDPYPTKEEKTSLAQESGLTVTQVLTWFANARRRRKRGASFHNSLLTPKSVDHLDDSQIITQDQLSALSPLDRWENSPPEIEPAPLEAIVNAVARSRGSGDLSEGTSKPAAPASDGRRKSLSSARNDAQSVVSSGESGSQLSSSSGSSAYSFSSNHCGGSFSCFYVNEPRRRRRRRRRRSKPFQTVTTHRRPFQCTFCTDTFRTKHDWTRHEKTLHLFLEKFTCAPFGSVYSNSVDGINRCVFCDEPGPSESHIEGHRFSACQQKSSGFRTFYRKDHLVQHLRSVHQVSHITPTTDDWKSQVEHINSRCGFCDKKFAVGRKE